MPVADEVRETDHRHGPHPASRTCSAASWPCADSPVLDAVRRALTLLPAPTRPPSSGCTPTTSAEIPADGARRAAPTRVRVVGDPAVERAGAVAETGPRRIDAQLMSALERVQAVLRS